MAVLAEPGIVVLCVFSFANLPAQVAVTPVVTSEDLFSITGEKCVVAISDTLLQQKTRVGKETRPSIDRLLDLAGVAFREEPNVVFGVINFEKFVLPSGEKLKFDQNTKAPTAVVFYQSMDDYHELTGVGYGGSGSVADFIAFVNDHCNTYRAEDGRLTLQGLRRKALLEDFFKVEQLPQSVTISQVFQTPDLLHSDMNCLRKDGSDVCYSSQSVHRGIEKLHIPRCERISSPSRHKFFNEYLARSRPVIITDAMDNWPAMSKWTTEFLRDRYGDRHFNVQLTPNGVYDEVEPASIWDGVKIPQAVLEDIPYPDLILVRPAVLDMKFSDFLDLIRNVSEGKMNGVSAYLQYEPMSYNFSELTDDIEEMPFLENTLHPQTINPINMWLSDVNTLAKVHFDENENFLCQISGEKEVILFEPHSNERLYEAYIRQAVLTYNATTKEFLRAKIDNVPTGAFSPVDIQQPNLERFKKFGEARPMSCTIRQGEVLFIPAFWWHEVQSRPSPTEHRNLAVNFWYEPFFRKKFPCPGCRFDVNLKYRHLW